jgi:hypothetical protein
LYQDPNQKRDIPAQVRFEPVLDRILHKAVNKSRRQHATYLYEVIEWAVANGAIEELCRTKNKISWVEAPLEGRMLFERERLSPEANRKIDRLMRVNGWNLEKALNELGIVGVANGATAFLPLSCALDSKETKTSLREGFEGLAQ